MAAPRSAGRAHEWKGPGAEAERIMRRFTVGEPGATPPVLQGEQGSARDSVADFLATKAEARASWDSALLGSVIAVTALGAFEWIASSSESALLARLLGRDEGQRRMGILFIGAATVASLFAMFLLASRRARHAKSKLRRKLKVE